MAAQERESTLQPTASDMEPRIVEAHQHSDEVATAIRRGIREADPIDVGARDHAALCLTLRDADDALQGGLYGATMWGWLLIDGLWVTAELRGRGLGSQLLETAEAIAITRGCRGAWLGTFDFQARTFYERRGYQMFAELPDFPAGHRHFHLAKRFEG
jgi:GNAT superfamily N-acetyltransferase